MRAVAALAAASWFAWSAYEEAWSWGTVDQMSDQFRCDDSLSLPCMPCTVFARGMLSAGGAPDDY
jgi:hypothetical protein